MARYAKFIAALATFLGDALALGLVAGSAGKWTALVISLLGSVAVFAVPNATASVAAPAVPPLTPPPAPAGPGAGGVH